MKFKKNIFKNYHHLLEALFWGLISLLINIYFFPNAPFFRGYTLNPYLIFPMLLSLRYGSIEGFMDFVLIMLLALFGCYYTNSINYFFQNGWLFVIGVMFITQVAGQLSDRFRIQLDVLNEENKLLNDLLNDSVEKNVALTEANKLLSKKIVSRFDSMVTVYEAAKKLETLEFEELFPNTLDILKNHIMVKSGSIYILEKEKLKLTASFDSEEKFSRTTYLPTDSGMLKEVFEGRIQVSYLPYLQGIDLKIPNEDEKFLCVTPIITNDKIIGVIIVENISFMDFNRTTLKMLTMVSEWTAAALERINKYSNIIEEIPDAPDLYGYKAKYMRNQLSNEVNKSIRYNIPLSAVSIRIKNSKNIDEETLNNVSSVIGFVFKNSKRQIDLFGATSFEGVFLLILPVTDRKGMEIFINRILKEIDTFNFKPYKNSDKKLELEVFKISLSDIVEESRLLNLPKGEINSETERILERILEILCLVEE